MKKRFIPSIFSKVSTFIALFGVLCLFAIPVYATDGPMWETTDKMLSDKYKGKSYSPYAKRDFPNGLYWGDSHLHTGNSFDAGTAGCILDPDTAYRFAKGEDPPQTFQTP
jgi:hypothetical protein